MWWEKMQVVNGWDLWAVSLAYWLLLALSLLQDTFPDHQDGAGDPSESPLSPPCQLRPWLRVAGQHRVSGGGVVVDRGKARWVGFFSRQEAVWKVRCPGGAMGGGLNTSRHNRGG